MRKYTPRRAGKRWLENAPEYVLDVLDNKGETADRYTVIFGGSLLSEYDGVVYVQVLDMSDAPTHPQGVSMWSEYPARHIAPFRYREGHRRIRWNDLPENIRQHVIARVTE
jgi:hypothetical protein